MRSFLSAAALAFFALSSVGQAEEFKWAWEEGSGDGIWNFSETNWNFISANPSANLGVSHDAYEGQTSLHLQYLNQDQTNDGTYVQAFGYVLIPSSSARDGSDPTSNDDYRRSKDLSSYETLQFYIKGNDAANTSAVSVWLRSSNGHGSAFVPLKNYVTVNGLWQKVEIPVSAFLAGVTNPNTFQIQNVLELGFYVSQDYRNAPFDFHVDNVSFFKATVPGGGGEGMPQLRKWWLEDANQNGAYNYSTSFFYGGSALNVANEYGDLVSANVLTGPYGNVAVPAVDLRFHHVPGGYVEANLTSSLDNSGHEPTSFEDRDAGKAIASSGATLRFSAPTVPAEVKVKLVDAQGNSSNAVFINNYSSNYGRYLFAVSIPTEAFAKEGFDFNNVKSVTFFLDGGRAGGDYNLSVLGLVFTRP